MTEDRKVREAVPIKRRKWARWLRLCPSAPLPMTQHCIWGDADDLYFRGIYLFGINLGILYRGERHRGKLGREACR